MKIDLEKLLKKAGIGGKVADTMRKVQEEIEAEEAADDEQRTSSRPRGHGAAAEEVRRVSSSL